MSGQLLGLFATALLFYGQSLLTKRSRVPFLLMSIGNVLWFCVILYRMPLQIDLLATSAIFASISIRNLIRGPDELRQKES